MVVPGNVPLSIIRGIQFPEYILQCKDENVTVSIESGPEITYVPSGTYAGYDLFIASGTPAGFLYYNPTATTYILAATLTNGGLTDYFILPAVTEPTGTYTGVGVFTGLTAVATDHPVDLTGFEAEALVRRSDNIGAEIVLDLAPSVTDPTAGEITIPSISRVDTEALRLGRFYWDLVLKNTGSGERLGPYAAGTFIISDNITTPLAS